VVFRLGAVVADLWVGKDYNLPGVRRIGEDLLVSGDGGIKNNFPVTLCFGSVTFASEDAAIFERKDRLHADSGEWILQILAGPEEKENWIQTGRLSIFDL